MSAIMLKCKHIFRIFSSTKSNTRHLFRGIVHKPSQCLDFRSSVYSRKSSSDSKSQTNEEIDDDKQMMTPEEKEKWARNALSLSLKERFKVFTEEDADIILDADEINQLEQLETEEEQEFSVYPADDDEFAGYNLERGKKGVYDVDDLVDVLRLEKAKDICVIRVSKELRYADYLVLASAISPRHAIAMSEFLRKLHKRKKHESDPYVDIVGKKTCHEWKTMDFGNIVLHIFLPEKRKEYDLESLWTVGREYDELTQQKTPLDDVLELVEPHVYCYDAVKRKSSDSNETKSD
uniref:Mitochondrial assembly of ribosomal large subunit protein 1 n=1 Tax=Strigamia maritima TaxID=126957 RepID=T1IN47_STRMM